MAVSLELNMNGGGQLSKHSKEYKTELVLNILLRWKRMLVFLHTYWPGPLWRSLLYGLQIRPDQGGGVEKNEK